MKKILLIIAAVLFFNGIAAADSYQPLYFKDVWGKFSLRFDKKLYSEIKSDGLITYRLNKLNEARELEENNSRKILVMPGAPFFIFMAASKAASEPLTEYLNQFKLVQNVRELLRKYGRVAFSVSFLADETSANEPYSLNPKTEFELGIKETSESGQNQKIRSSLRLKVGFQIDEKALVNNARDLSSSLRPGVSLAYLARFFLAGGRITFPNSNLTFYLIPEQRFFTVSAISDFTLPDKRLGFYLSKDFGNRVFTVRSSYFLETQETQTIFHFFYQF